jgi:phospholipase/carboxylesterase
MSNLCAVLIEALEAFEKVQRQFHPLNLSALHEMLTPFPILLERELAQLRSTLGGKTGEPFGAAIERATEEIVRAVHLFSPVDDIQKGLMNVLRAGRKICRAQEILYPVRYERSVINDFFLEDEARRRILKTDRIPGNNRVPVGIRHTGLDDNPYARSGLSLYVPESYDDARAWPLVVALHGGFGHGRDYLWTWLREARSREFILLAPTSNGSTWSISRPEADFIHLVESMKNIFSQYNVDRDRILITGISDGATFALICGLQKHTPVTTIAPVSGVLAPMDLSAARGRRIFWVHGAQDWMFPVHRAIQGCKELSASGADVKLHIIQDLAHAYPREENAAILSWFDPSVDLETHLSPV